MRINGCLSFSFTSRSIGGGSGTLWSFSVFTNNNNALFLVLFAQVLCWKSRALVFWIWIFLTLCLCFKICGKSWCKTCNMSCSKEFLFLCYVDLAPMVVCHYINTNLTNLAWKRNQRKWERHVVPDRWRESDGSNYHQDNTTFQGPVEQKQVLLTKDSSLYVDGGSGDNVHLCVPVRTQWSPSWWPIEKNKRKTILSWLPVLPHLCHLCPWCWSTWSGPMRYDTIRLFFWRLRKCTDSHGTLWKCTTDPAEQKMDPMAQTLLKFPACRALKAQAERENIFPLCLRLIEAVQKLTYPTQFFDFFLVVYFILQVLRAIKHSPGLMVFFFWSIICAFTAGSLRLPRFSSARGFYRS